MTEIDRLRELLDKAGVNYLNRSGDVTIGYYTDDPHTVTEAMDGTLQVTGLTAEQVMRALGQGTCHKVRVHKVIEDEMCCSECGRFLGFAGDIGAPLYNYCPNCGRKVVDE